MNRHRAAAPSRGYARGTGHSRSFPNKNRTSALQTNFCPIRYTSSTNSSKQNQQISTFCPCTYSTYHLSSLPMSTNIRKILLFMAFLEELLVELLTLFHNPGPLP